MAVLLAFSLEARRNKPTEFAAWPLRSICGRLQACANIAPGLRGLSLQCWAIGIAGFALFQSSFLDNLLGDALNQATTHE